MVRHAIIQGGDPLSKDPAKASQVGTGGLGVLRAEYSTEPFTRGAVGAALRPGQPDSGGAQFFVCVTDTPELDFGGRRNADGQGFAAFGRVVSGMDVIKKIQAAPINEAATGSARQTLTPPIAILKAHRK